jgi:hypothetical protein
MSSNVMTPEIGSAGVLPVWTSVLVVVAHPDDESFGLGAILDAFTAAGATVEVLCLTHGEASTLHGAPGFPGIPGTPEPSPGCAGPSWPRRPTCLA